MAPKQPVTRADLSQNAVVNEFQPIYMVYGVSIVLHTALFLTAIVLAIINLKRCRGPAIMLIIGAMLGLLLDGVQLIIPLIRSGMSNGDFVMVEAIEGTVTGLMSLVSYGLIMAAVLIGRRAPSP